MKSILTLAAPIAVAGLMFAMTPSAGATPELATPPSAIVDSESLSTAATGCCWVYFGGTWYCIPCD